MYVTSSSSEAFAEHAKRSYSCGSTKMVFLKKKVIHVHSKQKIAPPLIPYLIRGAMGELPRTSSVLSYIRFTTILLIAISSYRVFDLLSSLFCTRIDRFIQIELFPDIIKQIFTRTLSAFCSSIFYLYTLFL